MDIGVLVALVVVLGIAAQWLAARLRMPAILPLILLGVVVGPVLGIVRPEAQLGHALGPLVGLAVAVILFEGGLRLRLHEFHQAAAGVHRLVYIGVPLAFALGTLAARFIGGLDWAVASVFGAISVVTGPTVVLPLLRHAMLNRRIAASLKWEAILNDPLGALLAVLVFQFWLYQAAGNSGIGVLVDFSRGALGGGLIGFIAAWFLGFSFRREWVPEFLKQPVTLALVLMVYVVANELQHESGLLAVTIMGITLGNLNLPVMEEMRRFKEYLSTLLVSIVFILLSANLNLSRLSSLPWSVVLVVPVLLFLVRPVTVALATLGSGLSWRERVVAAWAAPRGVVAAATGGVLAPPLMAAGYQDAAALEPLLFGLVFASVILQGGTLTGLARALGLAARSRNRLLIIGANAWSLGMARAVTAAGGAVLLVDNVWHRLSEARLAGVDVYYGEILSEQAEVALELTDVGILLAATQNDAYNALVCSGFAPELGREQVFQLAMHRAESAGGRRLARPRRGRIAFSPELRYETLIRRMYGGWRFQKTTLTGQFNYSALRERLPEEAVPVVLLRAGGALRLIAAANAGGDRGGGRQAEDKKRPGLTPPGIEPKAGDILINFVPPKSG